MIYTIEYSKANIEIRKDRNILSDFFYLITYKLAH